MPRPGFVADVDRSSPPVLFHHGDQLRLERLPAGRSRVIYPPEPSPAPLHSAQVVRDALAAPGGGADPLSALLSPGMRLTIAIDDISTPIPPVRTPDPRQRMVEEVLEAAAAAGVDDVVLLVAIGLRRRLTDSELRRALGQRVYDSFAGSGQLVQHDAEDPEALVSVGQTSEGEEVELNRRAAESDLLVHIHIHQPGWSGTRRSGVAGEGWRPLLQGLSSYRTLRAGFRPGMGEVLAQSGPQAFAVVATLGGDPYAGPLSVLGKREWEWSARDKATFAAMQAGMGFLPSRARQRIQRSWKPPLRIASVHSGPIEQAHAAAAQEAEGRQLVPVEGQTDVLTMGLPAITPFSVGSTTNPVLARWLGLACLLQADTGRPLVREGGVVIMSYPAQRNFDPVHHPSYLDFFEKVLPELVELSEGSPESVLERHESAFATDEWYRHLYRNSYAFHGAHPFGIWREASRALEGLGRAIVVGGDPATVHRLGLRPASTLADALELASDVVGADATITHLHSPPMLTAQVS